MEQIEKKYRYYQIGSAHAIATGERLFVVVGSIPIVVFNINSQIFAIKDVCSHDEGPIGDGEVEEFEIICPRHGARFDIRSGKALSMPAQMDIQSYPVRVKENSIEVGIPD